MPLGPSAPRDSIHITRYSRRRHCAAGGLAPTCLRGGAQQVIGQMLWIWSPEGGAVDGTGLDDASRMHMYEQFRPTSWAVYIQTGLQTYRGPPGSESTLAPDGLKCDTI